jgi:hypothetical protein
MSSLYQVVKSVAALLNLQTARPHVTHDEFPHIWADPVPALARLSR